MKVDYQISNKCLSGRVLYAPEDLAIDFEVQSKKELRALSDGEEKASIAFGTLEIWVGVNSRKFLFPGGYFPKSSWKEKTLPEIETVKGTVSISSDEELIPGVAIRFATSWETVDASSDGEPLLDWEIFYDTRTNRLYFGPEHVEIGHANIEFADDSIVSVSKDNEIVSLWLRPNIEEPMERPQQPIEWRGKPTCWPIEQLKNAVHRLLCGKTSSTSGPRIYDVFVCHASEGEPDIVWSFVHSCDSRGVGIFDDAHEAYWGNRLLDKISYGLTRSKLVVVFVSAGALEKPYVRKQLHTALHWGTGEGRSVVPILLGMTTNEIMKRYPEMVGPHCLSLPVYDPDAPVNRREMERLADELVGLMHAEYLTLFGE